MILHEDKNDQCLPMEMLALTPLNSGESFPESNVYGMTAGGTDAYSVFPIPLFAFGDSDDEEDDMEEDDFDDMEEEDFDDDEDDDFDDEDEDDDDEDDDFDEEDDDDYDYDEDDDFEYDEE